MEELVARFEAGDVMYDVGAHAGRYSLLAASIGARVVSFEPNPHAYSRLTANFSANGYSSIASLNIGLGEESGKQVFYISSQEPRSSFKRENAEYGSSEIVGEIEVPIEPLDEFADEYSAPDHLKVDVEGFGLRVLRGGERMIAEQRPIIFFEAHGNADEAYDWCEEMGYTVNEIGYPWVCIPNEKE